MNGSSLGKYSGSAQYNSTGNWAAAGNNPTLAGASAAHQGWRLHQQLTVFTRAGEISSASNSPASMGSSCLQSVQISSPKGTMHKAKSLTRAHPLVSLLHWAIPIFSVRE